MNYTSSSGIEHIDNVGKEVCRRLSICEIQRRGYRSWESCKIHYSGSVLDRDATLDAFCVYPTSFETAACLLPAGKDSHGLPYRWRVYEFRHIRFRCWHAC